mmetsp:Transcript_40/g.170  ORF Transcript_40/g.170 Transcript_40/m.170 type:complete len:236 (+) Transcript_40:966-1673(+)
MGSSALSGIDSDGSSSLNDEIWQDGDAPAYSCEGASSWAAPRSHSGDGDGVAAAARAAELIADDAKRATGPGLSIPSLSEGQHGAELVRASAPSGESVAMPTVPVPPNSAAVLSTSSWSTSPGKASDSCCAPATPNPEPSISSAEGISSGTRGSVAASSPVPVSMETSTTMVESSPSSPTACSPSVTSSIASGSGAVNTFPSEMSLLAASASSAAHIAWLLDQLAAFPSMGALPG